LLKFLYLSFFICVIKFFVKFFSFNLIIVELSELKGPKVNISLCYKFELKDDPRLKVFKKFMIDEIKN